MKPRTNSNFTRISAAMTEAMRTNAPKRTVKEWAAEYGAKVNYVYRIATGIGITGIFKRPSRHD